VIWSLTNFSKGWGFSLELLDDETGPKIELIVYGDTGSIDTFDPKPINSTTLIDGQLFPGDANVATTVGVVVYTVEYKGWERGQASLAAAVRPHSVEIAVADNNFSIPTADFGNSGRAMLSALGGPHLEVAVVGEAPATFDVNSRQRSGTGRGTTLTVEG
jgi:hypothetical protein